MREIKLRAWDEELKRMFYGTTEQFDDSLSFRFKHFETDEPVYMQYTGLNDKNGKEIYEGDIIVNGSVPGPCFGVKGLFLQTKYKVAMVNGCFVVECDPECVDDHVFENYHLLFEMGCDGSSESIVEVIGNVYENPELVK
ncbi:YopX family protein [Heyndrickxia faecalis]|uniref:YopX family protein n=1 Tax=Heyndrickxia faecalis TaxID=2824910 RepID=UPI003100F5C1